MLCGSSACTNRSRRTRFFDLARTSNPSPTTTQLVYPPTTWQIFCQTSCTEIYYLHETEDTDFAIETKPCMSLLSLSRQHIQDVSMLSLTVTIALVCRRTKFSASICSAAASVAAASFSMASARAARAAAVAAAAAPSAALREAAARHRRLQPRNKRDLSLSPQTRVICVHGRHRRKRGRVHNRYLILSKNKTAGCLLTPRKTSSQLY